jgi:tyrosinase-like protein
MRRTLAAIVVLSMFSTVVLADELRIRKNIDALSQEELSAYLHALDTLNKRDPTTVGSYAYFAALHDDPSVGPCEHSRDTFFPWHRALLYDFENALRASDPPRTSNVTIPYWNWSEVPSGKRYPTAYENETLLQSPPPPRFTREICKSAPNPTCERLSFPWNYLDTDFLSVKAWSTPAPVHFGGSSDQAEECSNRNDGQYGKLEIDVHNPMHFRYTGGLMARPDTAAEDPIFWSFHAFIDLLWWQWQQRQGHTVDTCLNCKLCGLNWTVAQVINSEGQLKVTYDFTPPQAAPTTVAAANSMPEPLPSVDLALSATEEFATRHTSQVTIPSKPIATAQATIQDVRISSPISYELNAFFYPQSEANTFDPKDRATRERRLVYFGGVWQKHNPSMADNQLTQTLRFDLTPYLNALVAEHAGEVWILDVRTYAPGSALEGLGAAARSPNSPLEFGGVGLSIQ